jgi:hypothetical protein
MMTGESGWPACERAPHACPDDVEAAALASTTTRCHWQTRMHMLSGLAFRRMAALLERLSDHCVD